ncbi:MAG TPA: transposase [Polyangiaceae bacterium]|nr:transposase [Polyangiaceae bacterium]
MRAPRQLELRFAARGGRRAGAGRPRKAGAGISHLRRPSLSRHHPLHVTLRVRRGISSLREHAVFASIRRALHAGKDRFGFALIQFSVQRDHLHLIAEARDRRALSRGLQGLSIRVARAVNGRLHREGKVFADRYHARALKTPRAVRLALRYVLLNARKHASSVPAGFIDRCSSAPWFTGFTRPIELAFGARAARAEWERTSGSSDPPVMLPHSWLLRAGQLRAGPFDVDEIPGG